MTSLNHSTRGLTEQLPVLLTGVAQKDPRAFARLHALTKNKMRKAAFAAGASASEIDDILQDAFMKIWHKADTFDCNHSCAITWMCTVTRNTAFDARRREGRRPVSDLDEAIEVPIPADASCDDEFDYENARGIAFRVLARLPEDRRSLITLAYISGESRADLSRRFGVPVGTIKTWLRRTLESVRKDCLCPARACQM